MNNALIEFYIGNGTNNSGKTFGDIMLMSNGELENTHDYIQWIFPTYTPSQCVEGSPVLDDYTVDYLASREDFSLRFNNAIKLMVEFWDVNQPMIAGPRFWATAGNHNHKRMTRFIESCNLFDMNYIAVDFFHKLLEYSMTVYGNELTKTNIYYWYKSTIK